MSPNPKQLGHLPKDRRRTAATVQDLRGKAQKKTALAVCALNPVFFINKTAASPTKRTLRRKAFCRKNT
jgi:hypothetical protein